MRYLKPIIFTLSLLLFSAMKAQDRQVLVFYKTEGFIHNSIPAGLQAIEGLGKGNNFKVKHTNKGEDFTKEALRSLDLVIFLNTTGDVLNKEQQESFEQYIHSGGSFFGIHSAAETEYDWEWYGRLVGAYFKDHPKVQPATIEVVQPNHPSVAHLPLAWNRADEWYNYKMINPEIRILLNLREDSYEGGNMGLNHPIAWYRELDGGGISVYTGGGHEITSYEEPLFVEHLLQCILFALNAGDRKK
ncbi:ThuA domain-containing protein [Antarcticibacterium arcticum]|uniref:ThuA domain-containing protein n=1 Tax=Antarcticibacterium arcticum TaxID=2585771 RepID=A0A5B8YKF5_9FLAO|nr:ThuA domain-containing protein [Antarcticibacterium arcticum]QED38352.1 ThuA domain-containing protein [Antarcticibacterium arcticum]